MTLHAFTVKQFGGRGWQQRARFPVDKLLAIEQVNRRVGGRTESGIQNAYNYWQSKRRAGRVRLDDYEWEPDGDVVTTLIDVSPWSPFRYRFRSHHLKYFRWMTDKPLAEFPHREIINACSLEYHSCKADAQPVAHHISHDLAGFRRDYLRLLLPLTDRSGHVSTLACVSRHLDSTAPAGSPPSTRGGSTRTAERHPPAACPAARP